MNSKQIYSIPTYDAAFKWILSEETLLPSFFHAFVSNLEIERATRLDDHMNPLQVFQLLRNFIYSNETEQTVASLKNVINLAVHVTDQDSITRHSPEASVMLQDFLHHFPDIQQAFPQPRFNGTMDFVCELNSGEFVIVELLSGFWDECWDACHKPVQLDLLKEVIDHGSSSMLTWLLDCQLVSGRDYVPAVVDNNYLDYVRDSTLPIEQKLELERILISSV